MRSWIHETLFVLSVCGVTILNIFVNGALIIALPTLGKALEFTESELQWPLNVYALSYGSLLLLFGRLADVVGAKRMFLFGTGVFAVWSIATGIAPNKASLIVFVALTGVGAAANTPTGIGIFAAHFPAGPTKNRAIAALGAGQAIGYIVGLIGGGFLCDPSLLPATHPPGYSFVHHGRLAPGELWRVIFYIQGGLAAVFFVLGMLTIPRDPPGARYTKGVDWVGAGLSVLGVGLLTFVLAESTVVPHGWRTPWVPALLAVSLITLGAFVAWEAHRERRGKSVIVPMSIWTRSADTTDGAASVDKTRMAPMVALVFLAWGSYNTLSYLVTLFFQQVRRDAPRTTSLETLPFAIMAFVVNVAAGAALARVRGDVLIGIGLLGTLAAPLLFVLLDAKAGYWLGAFWIMMTIAWTDVAYTVGNLQISIAFGADSQGLAGGIFNVATRIGTSLSLALASSVATAVSDAYRVAHPGLDAGEAEVLMAGFRAAGWVSFALAAASFVVCVVWIRGIGVIGKRTHAEASVHVVDEEAVGGGEKVATADPLPITSSLATLGGDADGLSVKEAAGEARRAPLSR